MLINMNPVEADRNKSIKSIILQLTSMFGYMLYTEILDFFPSDDELSVKRNLTELLRTKELTAVKKPHQKKTFYIASTIYNEKYKSHRKSANYITKDFGDEAREKYYSTCSFVRYLLNCKDENGYLINNIEWIGNNSAPFDIVILCNDNIYDIGYCEKDRIRIYNQILIRLDIKHDEEIEKIRKRSSPEFVKLISSKANDRIIIVDDVNDMDMIRCRYIKYIVCPQKRNSFLIKEGA